MSKRKQAFNFFDEGKSPHSLEVEALGLSRRLRNRYFREWKRLQEPEEAIETHAQTVSISSIPMGGKFEYEDKLYQKVNVVQKVAIGVRLIEQDNQVFLSTRDRVILNPDTQVVAK